MPSLSLTSRRENFIVLMKLFYLLTFPFIDFQPLAMDDARTVNYTLISTSNIAMRWKTQSWVHQILQWLSNLPQQSWKSTHSSHFHITFTLSQLQKVWVMVSTPFLHIAYIDFLPTRHWNKFLFVGMPPYKAR